MRIGLAITLQKHGRKRKKALWSDISEGLLAGRKNRPVVNLGHISKNSTEGSTIVVAGKVLGDGELNHKVTVAAYSFSDSARNKIKKAGGTLVSLSDFVKSESTEKDVIILG